MPNCFFKYFWNWKILSVQKFPTAFTSLFCFSISLCCYLVVLLSTDRNVSTSPWLSWASFSFLSALQVFTLAQFFSLCLTAPLITRPILSQAYPCFLYAFRSFPVFHSRDRLTTICRPLPLAEPCWERTSRSFQRQSCLHSPGRQQEDSAVPPWLMAVRFPPLMKTSRSDRNCRRPWRHEICWASSPFSGQTWVLLLSWPFLDELWFIIVIG